MRVIPETSNRKDWPRLVAREANNRGRAVVAAQSDIVALQAATDWSALADYADDAAAAIGGVPVGALYRTGSVLKVRVS